MHMYNRMAAAAYKSPCLAHGNSSKLTIDVGLLLLRDLKLFEIFTLTHIHVRISDSCVEGENGHCKSKYTYILSYFEIVTKSCDTCILINIYGSRNG